MNTDKYKKLPPEFIRLAEEIGLADHAGPGFERRKALAEVTGISTEKFRAWLRDTEGARATGPNIGRLRTALRVLGHLPTPSDLIERLEFALGLGLVDSERLIAAIDVNSSNSNVVTRVLGGSWTLSSKRQSLLDDFLSGLSAKVEDKAKEWRQVLLQAGFPLAETEAAPLEVFDVLPAPRAEEPADPISVDASPDALVRVIAPMLLGLKPLLAALLQTGQPEHFASLRASVATGATSNAVFEVKQLLGPLCSERARQITQQKESQ